MLRRNMGIVFLRYFAANFNDFSRPNEKCHEPEIFFYNIDMIMYHCNFFEVDPITLESPHGTFLQRLTVNYIPIGIGIVWIIGCVSY